MSILFQPDHIDLIRDGEKTATRRVWDDDYPRPKIGSVRGAITELFTPTEDIDCWISITDVYRERLCEMKPHDYDKEGAADREEFAQVWRDIHGEWNPLLVVDVVEFEYVGQEHPAQQAPQV